METSGYAGADEGIEAGGNCCGEENDEGHRAEGEGRHGENQSGDKAHPTGIHIKSRDCFGEQRIGEPHGRKILRSDQR